MHLLRAATALFCIAVVACARPSHERPGHIEPLVPDAHAIPRRSDVGTDRAGTAPVHTRVMVPATAAAALRARVQALSGPEAMVLAADGGGFDVVTGPLPGAFARSLASQIGRPAVLSFARVDPSCRVQWSLDEGVSLEVEVLEPYGVQSVFAALRPARVPAGLRLDRMRHVLAVSTPPPGRVLRLGGVRMPRTGDVALRTWCVRDVAGLRHTPVREAVATMDARSLEPALDVTLAPEVTARLRAERDAAADAWPIAVLIDDLVVDVWGARTLEPTVFSLPESASPTHGEWRIVPRSRTLDDSPEVLAALLPHPLGTALSRPPSP